MIEKKLIKKILRDVLRRSQGLGDHHIMHPVREWFFGLGAAALTLSITVFFCVQLYLYYSKLGPSTNQNGESTVVIYRAEEVDKALVEFAERKDNHKKIKQELNSIPTAPEPTLPPEVDIVPETFPIDNPVTGETTEATSTIITDTEESVPPTLETI